MVEKKNIEFLESKIFEITIAHLSNTEKELIDSDFIELNDVEISLDFFKNCFFNSNSSFFELNHQFRNIDTLNIHNKTIKYTNIKSHKNGTKIDLYDIMVYKYLKNKKTKVNDNSRLILMKEISNFYSLIDFQVYHNHLSYENILSVFNNHCKENKKYFRFKIKTNYYSVNLDENLVLYFNFLVKIPKKNEEHENENENTRGVISKEDIDDNSRIDDDNTINHDNTIDDDSTIDGSVVENKDFEQPILNNNPRENIIYSNYIKKINTRISHPKLVTPEIENKIIDNLSDDDDISSESNLTISSIDDTETNDTFF